MSDQNVDFHRRVLSALLDAEAYFDLGEHTLLFYLAHGAEDRAVREDALSDLGISEEELERIAP